MLFGDVKLRNRENRFSFLTFFFLPFRFAHNVPCGLLTDCLIKMMYQHVLWISNNGIRPMSFIRDESACTVQGFPIQCKSPRRRRKRKPKEKIDFNGCGQCFCASAISEGAFATHTMHDSKTELCIIRFFLLALAHVTYECVIQTTLSRPHAKFTTFFTLSPAAPFHHHLIRLRRLCTRRCVCVCFL